MLMVPGLRPNVVIMTSLLGACDHDAGYIFRVVQEMKDHCIVPDDLLLQRMSTALSRVHQTKRSKNEQQAAGPTRTRKIVTMK